MNESKLRYLHPAADWRKGLPIGNGRLGAVVIGGAGSETLHLTETTYWSGKPEPVLRNKHAKADLQRMRQAFFDGDFKRGEELAQKALQPEKGNFGTNLALCDIRIDFPAEGEGYERVLDLNDAIVRTTCRLDGKPHVRETFASHPDGVLAMRIWSGEEGRISFRLSLAGRTDTFESHEEAGDSIAFRSRATENVHSDGTCGVRAQGLIKVAASGGSVAAEAGTIVVNGALEAFVYFAAATDYGQTGGEWAEAPARQIKDALAKGYERLRADHIADHRSLFERIDLQLGFSDREQLPTDERIRAIGSGLKDDPQLYALFYQYGRYLSIAGSRADSPLPMHLQGIWNDGEASRMAWSCDYHLDVNTEMNYYLQEAAGLGECHLPLMRFIGRLAEAGRETAQGLYGCEGWAAHVFTNAWGFSQPGWYYSWGLNVTGGLWLATHLREHYEFGLDREFLAELAYPVLKEAAAFFLDYMTVHPKYGWLVTGPSNSPENSFYPGEPGEGSHHLSMGPTMDQVLVRDLFEFCLKAAGLLDTDRGLQERLKRTIALLPPLQIGASGQLQEWLEDYAEAEPDHRHLSHLFSLYPGNQITPERTPALSEAAKTTLESRMRGDSLEDVEFTLSLFAAGFARLHDGGRAHDQLAYLLGQLVFDNLLTFSKAGIAGAEANIFVIDGNFGGAAAIGEMLLQSHADAIRLLPALPKQWHTGRVSGLRAKGSAEIGLVWENGRLTRASVKAHSAGTATIRYGELSASLTLVPGAEYLFDGGLNPLGESSR
ncbi:glycoside hydrolase family 95 protein [Paenibacillus humicola]|uniref:glycoside hydrolase family 95 protein n=1 Tax=Paenibacillus humicola TaxID=3110540 RepID=UPI00237A205C|nr:glycoside hydrolase family 95 protein [Paenibacillus humicola]